MTHRIRRWTDLTHPLHLISWTWPRVVHAAVDPMAGGFALPALRTFRMTLEALLHHFERWEARCLNGFIPAFLVGIFLSLECHALDCPQIPQQARKDLEVAVKAAVGRIGPAKGAELETLTRATTQDLMGKLPQADRVYLEQMMYATYCSALRDDQTLSESAKAAQIRTYNVEVRKTLLGPAGKPQGRDNDRQGPLGRDEARIKLGQLSLPFTEEAFLKSASNVDVYAVKLFLAAGMNPNVADSEGVTALMLAAGAGSAAMVDVLLKAKADVNQRKRFASHSTALAWAVVNDRPDILRALANSGASSGTLNQAFQVAAWAGKTEMLHYLHKQGVDLKNAGGEALIAAAGGYNYGSLEFRGNDNKRVEAIKFLLLLGVDPNSKDKYGGTALHGAAVGGRAAFVRALVDAGANINAKDDKGATPLMRAAQEGRTDVVRVLIERGASVNEKDVDGRTALRYHNKDRGGEIERMLQNAGAM